MSINDPMEKYVPFPKGLNGQPILIRHVLSHSSGIPATQASMTAKLRAAGKTGELIPLGSRDDFFAHVLGAAKEIKYSPGERFMYNNDTYQCLGYVVEKVAGKPYDEYVKENIFIPLGMTRSTYHRADLESDLARNSSPGHVLLDPKVGIQPFPYPFNGFDYANGGVVTSIVDELKLMLCLINYGELNGHRLLNKETLEMMWTPRVSTPADYLQAPGGYGYGIMVEENFLGTRCVQHSGNIMAYANQFILLPEKKLGVVVGLNNGNYPVADIIARGILASLMGQPFEAVLPNLKYMDLVKRVTGKYALYRNMGTAEVGMKAGMLTLTIKNFLNERSLPLVVEDIEAGTFFMPIATYRQKVEFKTDPETNETYFVYDRFLFHKQSF